MSKSKAVGSPVWMTTFADLMSLLLTFFVLLLSFAEMDIIKFRDAMGSIQSALGIATSGSGMFEASKTPKTVEPDEIKPPPPLHSTPQKLQASEQSANQAIADELNQLIKSMGLDEDVSVESKNRGVILKVKGRVFFNAGTAVVKDEAKPVLDKIADILEEFTARRISIEGHTDNIPISTARFSSNWELSTARAASALRYLQDSAGVNVNRISIAGFADTRPIATNDDPDGRAENRRVEFVFYEEKDEDDEEAIFQGFR